MKDEKKKSFLIRITYLKKDFFNDEKGVKKNMSTTDNKITADQLLERGVLVANEHLMREALKRGANPNQEDEEGYSLLMRAVEIGEYRLVETLLMAGANVLHQNKRGETVFDLAMMDANEEMFYLLNSYAFKGEKAELDKMNAPLTEETKTLINVLKSKEYFVIPSLLARGASADVKDDEGRYLVHLAVLNDDWSLLDYLIENNEDLNHVWEEKKASGLMLAFKNGNKKMAKALIQNKVDLDLKDGYNETVLHHAVRQSQEDIFYDLLARGANLNIQNNKGWTPLVLAVRRGNKKMVSWLVKEGTNLALEDQNGWQALTWAADLGHSSLAKMLINAGADINHQDKKGRTALMRAVKNEYTETVFTLLMHNADEKIQDIYGKTALDYAVERGAQESIKLLSLTENLKQKKEENKKAVEFQKEGVQEAFFDDDGKVFASVQKAKKHQIYQLKTDGKELYLTPVSLKKSNHLQKILKDVLLFNLKREKE